MEKSFANTARRRKSLPLVQLETLIDHSCPAPSAFRSAHLSRLHQLTHYTLLDEVITNMTNIRNKWTNELPRNIYQDVDWADWSHRFDPHVTNPLDFYLMSIDADDADNQANAIVEGYRQFAQQMTDHFADAAHRVLLADEQLPLDLYFDQLIATRRQELSQLLYQIFVLLESPASDKLVRLYEKYRQKAAPAVKEAQHDCRSWMELRLPNRPAFRRKRLEEHIELYRQRLTDTDFLSFKTDGIGAPLPPDEALLELTLSTNPMQPDPEEVGRYIYANRKELSEEQIQAFFTLMACMQLLADELQKLPAPTPASPLPAAEQSLPLDPHNIISGQYDKAAVRHAVIEAQQTLGNEPYKQALLLKVMLDHRLLTIGQSDYTPFVQTLMEWGIVRPEAEQSLKGSIRQRLSKLMTIRKVKPGMQLPLYKTWPENDPDRQLCEQIAPSFVKAGFDYPRTA